VFSKNDTSLYSAGTDGIVYEWQLSNGHR